MKRFILLLFLSLPFVFFAQGVSFDHSTWQEILNKAKTQNKIIFMDAYTTWCGPCKVMSAQTFPEKSVGDFYNANFINVKMDMESGEGPDLAKRYDVVLYPTLLYIDAEGNLLHRAAGLLDTKEFIELGKIALAPEKRLAGLEARYQKGDRDPGFLTALLAAKSAAFASDAGAIADEYLKTQGDLGSEKNMDVIIQYSDNPYSVGFQYFIKNKERFKSKYGDQKVVEKIERDFNAYLTNKPDISLEEVDKLFKTCYPDDAERMSLRYRISSARQKGDREGFANAATTYFLKFPSKDADELNEMAWLFYKVVDDKKMLKKALKWSKKSVKYGDYYQNNNTLAALYYKLNKKKSAIKAAQKSIEQARAAGEDFSQIQDLLDNIYKL